MKNDWNIEFFYLQRKTARGLCVQKRQEQNRTLFKTTMIGKKTTYPKRNQGSKNPERNFLKQQIDAASQRRSKGWGGSKELVSLEGKGRLCFPFPNMIGDTTGLNDFRTFDWVKYITKKTVSQGRLDRIYFKEE